MCCLHLFRFLKFSSISFVVSRALFRMSVSSSDTMNLLWKTKRFKILILYLSNNCICTVVFVFVLACSYCHLFLFIVEVMNEEPLFNKSKLICTLYSVLCTPLRVKILIM